MMTGGCYCGALRYEVEGEPMFRGQCHCRECQKIAGGAENYFMAVPVEGFRYVKGEPARYSRPDLENPVTREFCATCGGAIGEPLTIRIKSIFGDPKHGWPIPRSAQAWRLDPARCGGGPMLAGIGSSPCS